MRVLLNFSVTKLEDMLVKGNVWYLLHYRRFFDRYVVAYVMGRQAEPIEREGVTLVPLGTGKPLLDLALSPFRVFKLAKKYEATDFLTADLVFGWWHSLLLRWLLGAKVIVMPVCSPPEIIQTSGRTYSGFPNWIERLLIMLTFGAAAKVLCVSTDLTGIAWVRSTSASNKLVVVPVLPEEFPTPEFFDVIDRSESVRKAPMSGAGPVRLIYVGRLEREKLVNDLVDVAIVLRDKEVPFSLRVVGDGLERDALESRVREARLEEHVQFLGFQQSSEVAQLLIDSDIFVSPYTGTSVREAALAGLPIVAYRLGIVADMMHDGENCLMADQGDIDAVVSAISKLCRCPEYAFQIGDGARQFATGLWSPERLISSLNEAFDQNGQ